MVVDLGFGDSGKGLCVDWLCSREDPAATLAARYSGGYQVGHTVCRAGRRHVFSNFCAGTLAGSPGYFSADTIVFPPGIECEAIALDALSLESLGGHAIASGGKGLWLDPLAGVAVPADIAWNRARERVLGHGSCGTGYGAAVERQRAGVSVRVKDLAYPWVLERKLEGVAAYYRALIATKPDWATDFTAELAELNGDAAYIEACLRASARYATASWPELSARYERVVLEGNQGIMLDEEDGLYPHVTWGACGSAPALALLERSARPVRRVDIFYVTRCYQTRHGAGPMSSLDPIALVGAEDEANVENPWQGPFRVAELDPELLLYALASDAARCQDSLGRLAASGCELRRNLLVTCLDQRPGFNATALVARLRSGGARLDAAYGSRSPTAEGIATIDA